MTEHPAYLDALARAADWERPADERTDAARPRPRSRFEPDGLEPDADQAWAETTVETDAVDVPTGPTPARDEPAAPALSPEVETPMSHAEPVATALEPVRPAAHEAPPPAPPPESSRAEVGTHEPGRPSARVEMAHPPDLPIRPAPAVAGEPEPAVPLTSDAAPAAGQPEPGPASAVAEAVDRVDPAVPRETPPATEPIHEARPVVRAVEATAPEESGPSEPEADAGPTVIVVEIGRIEVRLAHEADTALRPTIVRPPPGPSLADYLRDRSTGEGRPA